MSASTSWPARFARARILDWTVAVTSGVPIAMTGDRVAEIASDLWDQSVDADARGISGLRLAVELLARAARGAPADISWRGDVRCAAAARPWVPLGRGTVLFDQANGVLVEQAGGGQEQDDVIGLLARAAASNVVNAIGNCGPF